MTREQLLEKYNDLFWYHKKDQLNQISDFVLVEFILNYGDIHAVRDLIGLLGIEKTAEIFFESISKNRDNYLPQVKNFFYHYFSRHASRSFIS